MQDQGKRLLLAVALALGVFLVWNTFVHHDEPPPRATSATAGGSGGSAISPTLGTSAPRPVPVENVPRPPEETLVLRFPTVEATFSNYCGGLKTWQLTDKRYEHDVTKGWLLPKEDLLTVTEHGASTRPPAAQLSNLPDCGAFEVNFASSTYVVPRGALWTSEKLSETKIRYTYASERLEVVNTFELFPERYLVRLTTKVSVHVAAGSEAKQRLTVSMYGFQDPEKVKAVGWGSAPPRAWSSSTLRDNSLYETDVAALLEAPRGESGFQWAGYEHPYLLDGFAAKVGAGENVEKHTWAAKGTEGQPRGFMSTFIAFPETTFRPGDAALTREVVGYLGPKNYDDLAAADVAAGFPTGFKQVVDLGWFAFIGRPLLWLLQKFHEVIGNWGVAIILLTFLVKGLTLYWTTKSMRSMKAMAALAPEMKALQAKYADDKQRQQAETMALYKQHNVNPVAGCLPILLQMPIWIALYRMLSSAGELYQQPFISGWIGDLTAPDPLHILTVLLVVTSFLQARLQPASVDSAQQKFLQYGLPIMFGVMSFVFPAGLTLYIFTNTVLSALHSIYMNKFDKKSLAIAERMKKQPASSAESRAGIAGTAKSVAKSGGLAKRAIDTNATEVPAGAQSDQGDHRDATPGGTSSQSYGAARNRPRRKRRKR